MSSVQREVVGSGVTTGVELLPLHEQVVEQARRPDAEPVRVEPVLTCRLVDEDEVPYGVLRRADAPRGLEADHAPRRVAEVSYGLEHDERDRQRRRGRDLAGARLDEVGTGQHG